MKSDSFSATAILSKPPQGCKPFPEEENAKPLPPHIKEWRASGVVEEIIQANVRYFEGEDARQILVEAAIAKIQRVESYITEPAKKILERNENALDGGWFVSGLDPLNGWSRMEWGQFKPNRPRIDPVKGKAIKYQSPEGMEARAILLEIPSDPGYWARVIADTTIPLYVCEGAKKAGLLLSLGYAAIALPGIWMGGRWRDKHGKLPKPHLIPELAAFAQEGRTIIYVPDQDKKEQTQISVAAAVKQTGKLLEAQGCNVLRASWEASEGKGIDDVWATAGADRVQAILAAAAPLTEIPKIPDNAQPAQSLPEKPKQAWLAEQIVLEHGENLIYNSEIESWMQYSPTSGIWGVVSGDRVQSQANNLARKFYGLDYNESFVSGGTKLARIDGRILKDGVKIDPDVVVFQNTALRISTLEQIPHSRENNALWALQRDYDSTKLDWLRQSAIYSARLTAKMHCSRLVSPARERGRACGSWQR
jgi:hypothetical protein